MGVENRIYSVEQDQGRFRQIVKGVVKRNLRKYMTRENMIGRKGKDLVSIPVPEIELPHFRFGRGDGGVGQGEGDVGDPIGRGEPGKGGTEGAGNQPGQHIIEVEMEREELDAMLADEFKLRRLRPKKKGTVTQLTSSLGGSIRRKTSWRHQKGTLKRAIITQISRDQAKGRKYDPKNIGESLVLPEVHMYKQIKEKENPSDDILVVIAMDYSGSMGGQKRKWAQDFAWLAKTALELNYKKKVTVRWIVYDAAAKEVDEDTAMSITANGGTRISTGYKEMLSIFKEYNPEEKDMYGFNLTDGDNWGADDDQMSLDLMKEMLPLVRLFGVVRLGSMMETAFIKTMQKAEADQKEHGISDDVGEVVNVQVKDGDGVWDGLRQLGGERDD